MNTTQLTAIITKLQTTVNGVVIQQSATATDLTAIKADMAALKAQVSALTPTSVPTPAGNDFTVHPRPETPVPAVGAWITDPTFGSRLYRVTGGGTESIRTQTWSYGWASDSQHFTLLTEGGTIRLYAWDGTIGTYVKDLPLSHEAAWSKTDPAVCYGLGYRDTGEVVVRRFNISTGALTDLVGVYSLVPALAPPAPRTYARGLTVCATGFTLLFGGESQDADHYAYFAPFDNPAGGKLGDSQALFGAYLHEMDVDSSGRYVILYVISGDQVRIGACFIVYDVQLNTFTKVPLAASASQHHTYVSGEYLNVPDNEDGLELRARALSDPTTTRRVIYPYPTPSNFGLDAHLSWSGSGRTIISGTFRHGERSVTEPWRACDDEILAVNVDTGAIRRLGHHHSQVADTAGNDDYWSEPKSQVSPDGKWILFTTNWRRLLGTTADGPRQDVCVLAMPG